LHQDIKKLNQPLRDNILKMPYIAEYIFGDPSASIVFNVGACELQLNRDSNKTTYNAKFTENRPACRI